ncbi:MAG: endonuclease III [Syntrophorhabdaceae bacterium]
MKKNIALILNKLQDMHGEPRVELHYDNSLELVIATVLSAQCTDERVNAVTEQLFKKYRKAEDYVNAPESQLEEDIRPTGFYHNKSRAIRNIAAELIDRFHGTVPDDIDTLATIRGIGRKSANMIVGLAYNKPAMIVDTHVARVARRIGFTVEKEPEKIELDLRDIMPKVSWITFSLLMILHGRYICKAKKPECSRCLVREDCNYYSMGGIQNV